MGIGGLGSFGALRADPPADAWRFPRAGITSIPTEHYLPLVTAVQDQGPLGSCTGQAFAKALEVVDGRGIEYSSLALYYYNRKFSGLPVDKDTGAYMQPSVEMLTVLGAGSEALWPYNVDWFAKEPAQPYQNQALDHRVEQHYRALTTNEVRNALANGFPVVSAFEVPPGFENTGADGVWHDNGGQALGGHAVCIVGYDDTKGRFLVCNSWGDHWGTHHPQYADLGNGYFWLPYSAYDGERWYEGIVLQKYDREVG